MDIIFLGRGVQKAKNAQALGNAAKKLKQESTAFPKMDIHDASFNKPKMTEAEIASAELELAMAADDLDFDALVELFKKTWILQRNRIEDEIKGNTVQMRKDFSWIRNVSLMMLNLETYKANFFLRSIILDHFYLR